MTLHGHKKWHRVDLVSSIQSTAGRVYMWPVFSRSGKVWNKNISFSVIGIPNRKLINAESKERRVGDP